MPELRSAAEAQAEIDRMAYQLPEAGRWRAARLAEEAAKEVKAKFRAKKLGPRSLWERLEEDDRLIL